MNLTQSKTSTVFILLTCLAMLSLFGLAENGHAQLLKQVREDFGNNVLRYAPDDPSFRSRLFNLQTGHSGAFYNCDGEEDKRNSPYICWKNTSGDRVYCEARELLNWKRDKAEIAQRICDGGCCGNHSHVPQLRQKQSCGCANCSGNAGAITVLSQAAGKKAPIASAQLRPKVSVAGLVGGGRVRESAAEKTLATVQPARIPSAKAQSVLTNTAQCDCLKCRAKRQQVAAAGVSQQGSATKQAGDQAPVATTRTASLLERARSSRKRYEELK